MDGCFKQLFLTWREKCIIHIYRFVEDLNMVIGIGSMIRLGPFCKKAAFKKVSFKKSVKKNNLRYSIFNQSGKLTLNATFYAEWTVDPSFNMSMKMESFLQAGKLFLNIRSCFIEPDHVKTDRLPVYIATGMYGIPPLPFSASLHPISSILIQSDV